jgi:hypothetical protein
MVGRLTIFLATLVVASAVAASARAADDSGTVVLGIEAIEPQDNNLASDVTDALKQRVATGKGGPLIPGKDLVEIKLVFSCSDEAPACLAQAGKSLGAAKLIYGNIKRTGGQIVLTLKQVDTTRGTLDGTSVENLGKKNNDPSALRALAGQLLARIGGGRVGGSGNPGTIVVRSNVSGATVMLDGAEVGTLAHKTLSIEDVSPGKHEITVEKPGFGVSTQVFTICAGQALPLTLTLLRGDESDDGGGAVAVTGSEPDASARRRAGSDEVPGSEDSARTWIRTGFWVSAGVSAISFALAAKYGLDVRSVNHDLDQFRGRTDLSATEQKTEQSKLAEGNRAETRQWIFIGVGSAAAVAGGVLLYKGYLDKEAGSGPKTADNHGLRVFPTANTSSGGIAAEFDF